MTAVYIRDNVDKANWGGRATSTALRQLIASKYEIIDSAPAKTLAKRYRDSRINPVIFEKICRLTARKRVIEAPVIGHLLTKLTNVLGNPFPITHDIENNAKVLQRISPQYPALRKFIAAIQNSESLVINLEGDGIFSKTPRHTLLMTFALAHIAKRAGCRIYYVNGMLSSDPSGYVNPDTLAVARQYLEAADSVVLRESASQYFADTYLPSVRTHVLPDALFSWRRIFQGCAESTFDVSSLSAFFDQATTPMPLSLRQPYIALGGSSAAAWNQRASYDAYLGLVKALKPIGLPVVIVQTCLGDAFLKNVAQETKTDFLGTNTPIMAATASLANARCFVSGRWHPSIMASLNGTPCVLFGSNSHKTLSLQTQLGYPNPHEYPAIPQTADLAGIIEEVRQLVDSGADLRKKISTTVDGLSAQAASVVNFM